MNRRPTPSDRGSGHGVAQGRQRRRFSTFRMRPGGITVSRVSMPLQQRFEFVAAAVNVADDAANSQQMRSWSAMETSR